MKTLILKNNYLVGNLELGISSLNQWFSKQMLHGEASINRTRFVKSLSERSLEISETRRKITEDNTVKKTVKGKEVLVYVDKEGKDVLDKKDAVNFKIKDIEKWNNEINDYLEGDYKIDVTPASADMIYGARDILLNSSEDVAGIEAIRYEEWCTAFQGIK